MSEDRPPPLVNRLTFANVSLKSPLIDEAIEALKLARDGGPIEFDDEPAPEPAVEATSAPAEFNPHDEPF